VTCFGQQFCPSSGALDCAIQHVVCCTQYVAKYWVQHTTSCIAQSKAPEDGQNRCPKHSASSWLSSLPSLLMMHGQILKIQEAFVHFPVTQLEALMFHRNIHGVLYNMLENLQNDLLSKTGAESTTRCRT